MELYLTSSSKPFYMATKPIGAKCNLDCVYCYYLEKEDLYVDRSSTTMTDSMLHHFVKSYIESHMLPEVLFTWHGGEPLLRGLNFFKSAIKYQNFYAKNQNIQVSNSLQTNGTLLTDEWCKFFKENNFLIGISIDGTNSLHDYYRKTRTGGNSSDKVLKGLRLLQKHGIEYNILSVVNNVNVKYPLEVYNAFKDLGARYIQFSPVVEQEIIEDGRLASPKTQGEVEVTEWSVPALEYGKFLNAIFDEWVKKDVGEYFVVNFDAMLANWMDMNPPSCTSAKTCGHALAMEHNGDVYACDHFVFSEYKRGNIKDKSMMEMAYSTEQIEFGNSKQNSLPQQCKSCKYLFACNGECPKNRIIETKDGEKGLNYLCNGLKLFYKHISPYMDFMVNELKNNRAPANVMKAFVKNNI